MCAPSRSEGTLVDAVHSPAFVRAMADLLARRRSLAGNLGQLAGLPAPSLRRFNHCLRQDCPTTPLTGEQSNSSVMLGDEAIMKFIRRFEDGINPGVELGRFLSERARLSHAPTVGRQHRVPHATGRAPSATIAMLEEFVPNEDDGWDYVVDALAHGLEEALANGTDVGAPAVSPRGVVSTIRTERPDRAPGRRAAPGVGLPVGSAHGRVAPRAHLGRPGPRLRPGSADVASIGSRCSTGLAA